MNEGLSESSVTIQNRLNVPIHQKQRQGDPK